MAYKKMSHYQVLQFIRQYGYELNCLWQYVKSLPANEPFQLGKIKHAAQIGHLAPYEMRKIGEVFSIQVAAGGTHIRYLGKASNRANLYCT